MIKYKDEEALIKNIASRIESVVKATNCNAVMIDFPFFKSVKGIDKDDKLINNRWLKINVSGGQYEKLVENLLHSNDFQEKLEDCINNRLTDLGKKKLSEITIYT